MAKEQSVGSKRRVVYISGCWDLFHVGHLWALQHARAMGDFLVVGCNTDEFMRSYKPAAPVCSYAQRRAILEALPCVDAIVSHSSIKDTTGFEEYGVNVRAFGPDYSDPYKNIVQAERTVAEREVLLETERAGIEVRHIPWAPEEISTTKIKEKVKCLTG